MAEQTSLMEKMGNAVARVRLLEREKDEAVARIRLLEREVNELKAMIAMAESKVEEILRPASVPQTGGPHTAGREPQPVAGRGTTQTEADLPRPYKQPF